MQFSAIDIIVFLAFVISVVSLGLWKSRHEKTGEDYFLAGRGLSWWLIGFSLIAANISTEQYVGMSGNAASHVGLAVASYEWMAAITLVIVGFCFLPYFLRAGIYTMPEFLEYRYNGTARTIMAGATIFIYLLLLGSVTYSGALVIRTLGTELGYDISLWHGSLVIGVIAMLYVAAGGLKACAWADLIQGSALIIGGILILYFAFDKLGAATEAAKIVDVKSGAVAMVPLAEGSGSMERFLELNRPRLNMYLPADDKVLPWTALLLGLWIPNFYYWGLNQYITQRTLGSSSLAQGQKGIVFAAFLKLIIPFAIVIPGIIAFNLYSGKMQNESVVDNAPVFARYLKANPDTFNVILQDAPSEEAVAAWAPGRFMLAVYDNGDAIKAIETRNPFVLPMTRSDYDAIEVGPFTTFESDDKAWTSIMPGLATELDEFNAQVVAAAEAAGEMAATEKFIAYKYDTAMAQLLGNVLPQGTGLLGFVLAALLGAVVSSLAAMLNAASTIFTMDIFRKYISPDASQTTIVTLGRICVVVFTVVAICLAPVLTNPKISNSIFTVIQEGQGLISPGILAVFVFGLLVRKAPPIAGVVGLLTNIVTYGGMLVLGRLKLFPEIQFLNRMAICFGLCLAVMAIITWRNPLAEPVKFESKTQLNLETSRGAKMAGIAVIIITLIFYVIFSPLVIAK